MARPDQQTRSNPIFLGLGANVGDRLASLRSALQRLSAGVEIQAVSSLYETEPVGVTNQPRFLNAVCSGFTPLSPQDLLVFVKRIEWDLGRRPGPVWGPRPLDIDILLYDRLGIATETLRVPHARLAQRAFVLIPLAELAPDLIVPVWEESVRDLMDRIDAHGVDKFAGRGWELIDPSPLEDLESRP